MTTTAVLGVKADTDANPKEGIVWERRFSPTDDPYEGVTFVSHDIRLVNARTGEVVWDDPGVLFPDFWSRNACDITSQHYLRGPLGSPEREKDVRQMIDRVVDTIHRWGTCGRVEAERYLPGDKSLFADAESAAAFACDLKYLIVHQMANFNSPVWYNIGVEGVPQQPSACFILHVDDTMDAILNWYREEGKIFQGGSGAGVNLSLIRSSYEGLRKGGWASGPVSYMCAADSSAGTMKSGGRSRRAAKMVVLDIDHPDIYETAPGGYGFIRAKARSEAANRALAAADFDMRVDSGLDAHNVQFQNANNSVRIPNAFMEALQARAKWQTVARSDIVMRALPQYDAVFLWDQIAQASWECADPGLQFDTTVNFWNPTPASGRINGSNPCSEYMHLDNSPCNLAATNLLSFLDEDGHWRTEEFQAAVKIIAIAQTVLAQFGDYPTEKIHEVAVGFREIGQGYTNLGAMLMANGLAYGSPEGRSWNAAITALMQAQIFATSAEIAAVWGVYAGTDDLPGFDDPTNHDAHLRVAEMHHEYAKAIAKPPTVRGRKLSIRFGDEVHIETFHNEVVGGGEPYRVDRHLQQVVAAGLICWKLARELGGQFGYANAQASLLAPMGTNGYMMDHDTSGIEPALSQKVSKKKVDGSSMTIVNQSVGRALRKLGYDSDQAAAIEAYVLEHNSVVGAPYMAEAHYPVFDTSFEEGIGKRSLSMDAHVLQMAAAQPFLSGAISKTVNMPESSTKADIAGVHYQSWRLGLKAVAIYRDNSKTTQPMSATGAVSGFQAGGATPVRVKLPRERNAWTFAFLVADCKGYVTVGQYEDGSPGEVFMQVAKGGSTLAGIMDAFAISVSLGLQHGVPLEAFVSKYFNMKFEPAGMTNDEDLRIAQSLVDYIFRRLAIRYLSPQLRRDMGILTIPERMSAELPPAADVAAAVDESGYGPVEAVSRVVSADATAPTTNGRMQKMGVICGNCGGIMEQRGTCHGCPSCGNTTGCS